MNQSESIRVTPMAWVVFLTGCAYYLFQYILRITPGVLSAEIQDTFSWQAAAIGAVSAAYFYAYTPMQLPVGVLMDQYGPRRLFILGTSLLTACVFLMALTDELGEAQLLHYLIGFGSSFAYIGTTKLAAEWFPEKHFATLVGLIFSFGMIGSAFGSNALVALSDQFGVNNVLLMLGAVGVAIALLVVFFVKDSPNKQQTAPPAKISTDKVAATLGQILKKPRVWLAGGINFIVTVPTGVIAGFAGVTILTKLHGLELEDAAFVNGALFIGAMFGSPGVAAIAASTGQRKTAMAIAIVVSGLCLAALIFMPSLPYFFLIALFAIIGFGTGTIALTIAIAKEACDNSMAGMVVAVVNMAGMMAPMLLQPLIAESMDGTPAELREALTFIPTLYIVALMLTIYGQTDAAAETGQDQSR